MISGHDCVWLPGLHVPLHVVARSQCHRFLPAAGRSCEQLDNRSAHRFSGQSTHHVLSLRPNEIDHLFLRPVFQINDEPVVFIDE